MGTQPFREKKREELKDKIIKLYKEGYSFRELSKTLGISHETARKIWMSTQVVDNN